MDQRRRAGTIVLQPSGMGAFELLIDPVSQAAYPEYGPNMMWNLKYGGINHSQMMGGWASTNAIPADVSADMSVTEAQAITAAQAYLDQAIPGTTIATDPVKFYGYYTLDFEKDGNVIGYIVPTLAPERSAGV